MLAIADPSGEKRKVVCSIWDNVARGLSNVEPGGARMARKDLAHKDWDDQVLVADELPMIEETSSPVSSVGAQQAPLALNQKVLQPVPALKLKNLAADTPGKLADKVPPAEGPLRVVCATTPAGKDKTHKAHFLNTDFVCVCVWAAVGYQSPQKSRT